MDYAGSRLLPTWGKGVHAMRAGGDQQCSSSRVTMHHIAARNVENDASQPQQCYVKLMVRCSGFAELARRCDGT